MGQLCGPEANRAIGFDLHKMGQPVEVEITVTPKRTPKRIGQ
jgi:hypothetical protein